MQIHFPKSSIHQTQQDIRRIVSLRANAATMAVYQTLKLSSIFLVHKIATSPEWNELTSKLIGEFGFAPYETSKFNEALTAIIPSLNDNTAISNIEILSRPGNGIKKAILNWVDWNQLAWGDIGEHKLTHWDSKSKTFQTTSIVSWLDWLEDGVIIAGYDFEPDIPFSKRFFSRSKEGLMKEGALWSFAPTKLFERTANTFDSTPIKQEFVKAFRRKVGRI